MAVLVDLGKCNLLRVTPRLMQILRVLARHKSLGVLRGKRHWPPSKELREAFEELGLTFLKFWISAPDEARSATGRLHW